MRQGIQEQEQVGLHHRTRSNDLVHLLGCGHRRRILQYVQRPPSQWLERPLLQDSSEKVVRVREVAGKEGGEGPVSQIHRLAHVSDGHLISLRHRRVGSVHEHVLQGFLHGHVALLPGRADEPCDRRVLQHRLLQIRLEGLEVLVFGFGQGPDVFFKAFAVLLVEPLSALEHLKFAHGIHEEGCELRCVPSGICIGAVPHAVRVQMVLQLFPVHEVSEQASPGDLCGPFQVGRTVTIEEFGAACHPGGGIKKA